MPVGTKGVTFVVRSSGKPDKRVYFNSYGAPPTHPRSEVYQKLMETKRCVVVHSEDGSEIPCKLTIDLDGFLEKIEVTTAS